MGLPDIVIEFTKKAIATISVGTGGLVGTLLRMQRVTALMFLRVLTLFRLICQQTIKPTLRELFWELRKRFTFLYFQRRLRITQRLISILQTRGSTISVVIRLLHLSLLQTCLHGLRANVKPERFTL